MQSKKSKLERSNSVLKKQNCACITWQIKFENEKLAENVRAFLNTIVKLKPSSAKGQYVKSLFLTSTMGPGLKITKDEIAAH